MKLIYRLLLRLFIIFTILLGVWAAGFYIAIMDEVNDEVDDQLENYAETIIENVTAGKEFTSIGNGTNNQHLLHAIDAPNATGKIELKDTVIYLTSANESEPARMLTTTFMSNNNWYELKVFTPTIEKADLREAISYWVIVLYVSLLVILLVVISWVLSHGMHPLYKLLAWMDCYKTGQKNRPLTINTDITEFKKLNEAIERYTQRNEKQFEQQREFIGNASHEMQTPLAICRNRLEMIMEDESLTASQLEELAKTYQTLEYLTRMNKSLLLLSKIDNGQFTEIRKINVNDIINHYIEDYTDIFQNLEIHVEKDYREPYFVNSNITLAEILVSNLLRNAYVHNTHGGMIQIITTTKGFSIANTAVSGALDKKRIFERFYQGTKKEGSTGLGLALVASICKLEHLTIEYSFANNMHNFQVTNNNIERK